MAFTNFQIKNFKCFQSQQSLLFAAAKEGFLGSGITYIVGANNSGKTTLIEALSIKEPHIMKTSELSGAGDPEFCLYGGGQLLRKCALLRAGSHTILENPKLNDAAKFEFISSRREWDSNASGGFSFVGQSFGSSLNLHNRQNTIQVAVELKTIEADPKKYAEFLKLVQRVIPEFTNFAIGNEDNEYIEYISGSGVRHKASFLGDGVITVIRILLQLYVARENALVIDEPELSLHPAAQKRLLEVIAEYSQRRQIVIATHSPFFINWKFFENGATINRVVKADDGVSRVFSILDFSPYKKLIHSANWQQPYLLDAVAKEVFFSADGLLFLEGQEDVGLLADEPSLVGVNIFGYGVRGKDNFKFAFALARDLGFRKVCSILDYGESETRIKEELSKAFPDYMVIQWNKSDIRDKNPKPFEKKVGYFNEDGTKKKVEDLDDFVSKLADAERYFKNNA